MNAISAYAAAQDKPGRFYDRQAHRYTTSRLTPETFLALLDADVPVDTYSYDTPRSLERYLPDHGSQQRPGIVNNIDQLIVVYKNPHNPPSIKDWWLMGECLMLSVFAVSVGSWLAFSANL